MALTKVSGGILDPGINVAGIVTATGFDGPFTGGSSKNITAGIITATGFDLNGNGDISGNLVVGGNLTANGDFTTLNTTLREVELLRVDANSSAAAGIITQRGSGDLLQLFDGSTRVGTITDDGNFGIGNISSPNVKLHVKSTDTGGGNIAYFDDSGSGATGRLMILTTGGTASGDGIKFQTVNRRYTYFGNATNHLTIDNNNARIGIGSERPTAKLDVNGHTELDNVNIAGVSTHNEGIFLPDDKAAKFGNTAASPDLEIFHSGSVSRIRNNALDLVISNTDNRDIYTDSRNFNLRVGYNGSNSPENAIVATGNGAVELYYDGLKTAFTQQDALHVYGRTSNSGMVEIASNQGANNNDRFRIHKTSAASRLTIQNYSTGSWVENIRITAGGAVELKHADGTTKFQTTSTGAKLPISSGGDGLEFFNSGDIYPEIIGNMNRTLGDKFLLSLVGKWNNNHSVAKIVIKTGDDTTNKDDGRISFFTAQSGGTLLERLEITPFGHVNVLGDSKKLQIGAGQDLQLYHDTNNSFIENSTGQLSLNNSGGNVTIRASDSNADFILRVGGSSASENAIVAVHHGEVVLSFNGVTKLTTTNTGITVTGEVAASQDYPNFRPTLDLNFAAEKKLDPRITYQRTGVASFVNEFGKVVLVGDNAPRFDHDPVTRESKGLLIEESRTNIVYPSSDWTYSVSGQPATNWTHEHSNTTREPNTTDTEDPAGTFTATKITPTNASTLRSIYWGTTITFTNAVKFTMSAFAKSTTGLHVQLRPRGQGSGKAWATFNLTTGVVGNYGGSSLVSTKIEKYPNDWYRCSLTFTGGGHTSGGFGALIMDDGNDGEAGTHTGDPSKSIFFWGAQFETGSYATSYIPTSGSTATRGADIVLLDDIENEMGYNQLEGTAIMEYNYTEGNDGAHTLFAFSGTEADPDNSAPRNWLRINKTSGTARAVRYSMTNGGTSTSTDSSAVTTPGVFEKFAFAYEAGDQDLSFNGTSILDTAKTPATNIFRLGIGNIGWNLGLESTSLEGHIKRFMYYPKKLPNSQLNTLTS